MTRDYDAEIARHLRRKILGRLSIVLAVLVIVCGVIGALT